MTAEDATMMTTDGGNAKESRGRRNKGVVKCKACTRCRARKIKCDGQRPTCRSCISTSDICLYGQDGRQTSRVTKDNFKFMADKIAVLESIVRSHEKDSSAKPSWTEGIPPRQPLTSQGDTALNLQSYLPLALNAEKKAEQPATADDNGIQSGSTTTTSQGSPRVVSTGQETSPLGVHFVQEDRGSVSVHGPSSAFHFHASGSPPSSYGPYYSPIETFSARSDGGQPQSSTAVENVAHIQVQLIANAALERQKENQTLLRRDCDFDGVDFDTAVHLLDIHWNRQHHVNFLSYRPLVMQNLKGRSPYSNRLLWNAIFYASSLHSEREHPDGGRLAVESLQNRFYLRFQSLVTNELETPSVPSIVALLLVGAALVSNGKRSPGWLYCGLAYRMIMDLGLHLDDRRAISHFEISQRESVYTFAEIEMRRRVFWAAYVTDKFQSLYFGRPAALPLMGVEPPHVFLDTYEEMELWSPFLDPDSEDPQRSHYSGKPSYIVSSFQSLIGLMEISSEIVEKLYMPWTSRLSSSSAKRYIERIEIRLQEWMNGLPDHLKFTPGTDPTPPPHQFAPHTTYHMLHILLYRPLLAEGHLHHLHLETASTRDICTSSALKIYDLALAFGDAFGFLHAPFSFPYALFCAATVLPREEAQKDVILFFWNSLRQLQEGGANVGLRKPMAIIRDLMNRAGIDILALSAATARKPNQESSIYLLPPNTEQGMSSNPPDPFTNQLMESDEFFHNVFGHTSDWLNDQSMQMDGPNVLYGLFQ